MKKIITLTVVLLCVIFTSAQDFFNEVPTPNPSPDAKQLIKPAKAVFNAFDMEAAKIYLQRAPMEKDMKAKDSPFLFAIPMPNGTMETFRIVESPIMDKGLAARYPDIKTYLGQGLDHPENTVRFDITPKGFHAMVLSPEHTAYVDPYFFGETEFYQSYWKSDFYTTTDKVFDELAPRISDLEIDIQQYDNNEDTKYKKPNHDKPVLQFGKMASSGNNLRTYRLALAGTGEYTSFHGGTVAAGLAAMVTSMNRVNGVYERDVAIRMIIVANNDLLVYTNGATDPYSNGNGGAMLSENINNCNSVIGSANYDIGHVFSTGGGGVAFLGVPCTGSKAGGVTGQGAPVGDPFDIDYVCHEMGHQFGGNHTQNNSCNRSTNAAYEPGSASTIMGYAGICAPNLQTNSDDHFHNHSYNEIVEFSTNGSGDNCPVTTATGNTIPTLDPGLTGTTIPISTPFELTATASDPDGDLLTYNWEQYNLGPATAGGDSDLTNPSGNQPIFRSWPSSLEPTRVFPRITDLVNNTTVIGELLPTYSRNLTFRCTVRDNQAGAGGVNDAEVSFTVSDAAGPFLVNFPNTGSTFTGNTLINVQWDVANTNASPVNCANVDIYLSTDGGLTYPTLLAANTTNDGIQSVLLPVVETTTARIKVKASNNIFFDISNQNFTISGVASSNDNDAALLSINSPSGDICGSTVIPEITIGNSGLNTLTSLSILYTVDGGTPLSFPWTGSLTIGQIENVTLPAVTTADGLHSIDFELVNPNGVADEDASNNTGTTSYTSTSNPGCTDPSASNYDSTAGCDDGSCIFPCNDITITFDTDCWGGEVSWTLQDASGTVVASIAAGDLGNQTNYTWTYCLDEGCYDLIIGDTFGDGMNGTAFGCAVDGNYTVTDVSGTVLVQMADPNYGAGITENFCVTISSVGCTDATACNFNPSAITDDGSCVFPGCTDATACNYDSTAGCDDGSCISAGCIDSAACNFDSTAGCDDGSCIIGPSNDLCANAIPLNPGLNTIDNSNACVLEGYAVPGGNCNSTTTWCTQNAVEVDVFYSFTTPATPAEITLETSFDGTGTLIDTQMAIFEGCNGTLVAANDDGGADLYMSQLSFACSDLTPNTTYIVLIDGYNGNSGSANLTYTINTLPCGIPGCTDATACNYDATATIDDGSCLTLDECGICGGTGTSGCTDPGACNFDVTAACDDGSCEFTSCAGCTDTTACNYDATATIDDGSCLTLDECGICGGTGTSGCTDPGACNFDVTAACDDGSCEFTSCAGCTDTTACNYDATATIDDGSCLTLDECGICGGTGTSGCTDPGACNFDAVAACDDGSCEFTSCAGCTDTTACNYDATATIDDGSCLTLDECGICGGTGTSGCTDPGACNFDVTAACDDGSCEFTSCAGCTDTTACNYDATATIDDGSCLTLDECGICGGTGTSGCNDPSACNFDPTAACDDGSCEFTSCSGCTDTTACNYDATATIDDGSCLTLDECGICGGTGTSGCTDPGACNFDVTAACDDGSCEFTSCSGCTDTTACNYDATATIDDGSCLTLDECGICGGTGTSGCTDPGACNFDVTAACDDGSCEFTSCAGCTDTTACNYDATATIDDGSCLSLDECGICGGTGTSGCTDPGACNFDAVAACDDGSCEFTSCAGCTDTTACNYDATATIDDGSCLSLDECGICGGTGISGCNDPSACNFDPTADCDDGSCTYAPCGTCIGDANLDGVVNILDLVSVSSNIGCTSGCLGNGDANFDTIVDILDTIAVSSNFGIICD